MSRTRNFSSDDVVPFNLLLERLHPDREQAGKKYEDVRRKLIKFFGWNDCYPEEDLTDQTLDRVMGKLAAGEILNIEAFIWGVAKNIAREFHKKPPMLRVEESFQPHRPSSGNIEMDIVAEQERQRSLECLDHCIRGLPLAERELFLAYQYYASKSRNTKTLAKERGVAVGTLQIQAHRLKHKVVRCVLKCLDS